MNFFSEKEIPTLRRNRYTPVGRICLTSIQYQNQPITTNRTSICFSLTKTLDEQLITELMAEFASLVCLLREITD